MKTRNTLLAITAATLVLGGTSATAQYVDSVESLNNRAVANSPRAREAFPWLTRVATPRTEVCCAEVNSELTLAKRNRAFAASPRTLEEFPELARPAQPLKAVESSVAMTVIKNRAFAASPRVREEFPWLDRGSFKVTEEPFEIAPVK